MEIQNAGIPLVNDQKKTNYVPKQPVDLISAMDCSTFIHKKL